MYVQPLEGSLGANALSSLPGGVEGEGTLYGGAPATASGDNISRFVPPWLNEGTSASADGAAYNNSSLSGLFGPLMGMLQQLMGALQSLMGYGGCATPYSGNGSCVPYSGNGSCPPYGGESYFQNADGSSQGDPHLSFNGSHWTNMASQPDLLESNSFSGGYRISTQTTPPNAKGVSWNQSATISLNDGNTTIGMNNHGDPSIMSFGRQMSIGRGQTLQLGKGESVTCQQNGSLVVNAQNDAGGRISTTLSAKGNGVDVDVTAHDVDLGGALVNGSQAQPGPVRGPVTGPIGQPVTEPIAGPLPGPVQPPMPGPIVNPWPGPFTDPYALPNSNL